eukprot:12144697-Ditylum_brightwellii.AAC.1
MPDEDPNHLSHMWWLSGAAPSKTPEHYRYTNEDAAEHIKAQLDGNYLAWSVFHKVFKSFIGAAHEHTKKNVHSLPNYQNSWDAYTE